MDLETPTRETVDAPRRYSHDEGRVLISGVQALVRLALDQRSADEQRGWQTAGFVSGYPGSPLASLDLEFARHTAFLAQREVLHRPGLNEELAATAVAGTQLAMNQADRTKEGVFALWYGKSPGLDRASDAFRHGNLMGAGARGGVLVCVGDDPRAKSSSVPSSSEPTLYALAMPILSPADPQEVLDLGRHGIAMSRASGLWVGFRLSASVADMTQSVEVGVSRVQPLEPDHAIGGEPFHHQVSAQLLGAKLLELEGSLYGARLEMVRRYSTLNQLNRVTQRGPHDVLGIAAVGPAYLTLRKVLETLGLGRVDLERAGVRLLKVSMPYPLDPELVRDFANGLDEILVVEDKRPFVEELLKSALYGVANTPAIVGKRDDSGAALLSTTGDIDANALAMVVAERLLKYREVESVRQWRDRPRRSVDAPLALLRGAYFCSGCPHNTSMRTPNGTLVGSGSGCHGLAIQMDPERVGTIVGRFQMGGEGAMWNGMSPYVAAPHFVQNLGDGTYAHSGSLAVRAAVASGVNITFKILMNATVAMTGGQPIAGGRDIGDISRQLLAEGVRRVLVTSDETHSRQAIALPAGVERWPRARLIEAQVALAETPGVTVLIHEQSCAAETRRQRRRRPSVLEPARVHINAALCEGCGDCGFVSNCLSVRTVETAYGTKRTIHQESCNFDYSCVDARCPALVTVRSSGVTTPMAIAPSEALIDPPPRETRTTFRARLSGIGGTGVVTVAQILAWAAHEEGWYVREMDQTGIAQKGGAVMSDLRLSGDARETTAALNDDDCDLYLGFDPLVAATSATLSVATPGETVAVATTSMTPTGRQIEDRNAPSVPFDTMRQRVDAVTTPSKNVWLDAARIARARLGSDVYANIVLLGAAYQTGVLPLSSASIEAAIVTNGVDVEANLNAFRWGRLAMSTSDAELDDSSVPESFDVLVKRRVSDLIEYQDAAYAERYADLVERARRAEAELGHFEGPFSLSVATQLFRLMAIKDEYEVARLHLSVDEREQIVREFGPDAHVTYFLSPSRGEGRKYRVSRGARGAFRALRAAKRLRFTALDPFARRELHRTERRLRDEYVAMIEEFCDELAPESYEAAVELAALPSMVVGFGPIKEAAIERYEQRRRGLVKA